MLAGEHQVMTLIKWWCSGCGLQANPVHESDMKHYRLRKARAVCMHLCACIQSSASYHLPVLSPACTCSTVHCLIQFRRMLRLCLF